MNSFKIITVTGAHSGIGKTTLCSILLKELSGFGAIKFTKTALYTSLVDDTIILKQEGKDTALFLESGAQRVLWIQSPYNELESLLHVAMSRMTDMKGVIVEGNSPVDFLKPHLIIFIIDPHGEIKPSALKVSKRADIVIINSEKKVDNIPSLFAIVREGVKFFWIDLLKRKGELNEFLSVVKERITKGPH
jgi:molybdopterin-guanine dinucleotide biosynthesis protein